MRRKILFAAALAVLVAVILLAPLPFGETRIYTAVIIRRPPEAVFNYVTTPANWPQWHPASLAVSGATDHPLQIGEQTLEDFRVAGRRGQALWTVTAREAPRHWRIEASVGGHPAGSVSYTLTAAGNSTRFERELVYPSRNLLFALLNRWSIREEIDLESTEALAQLKDRLEGGS